MAIFKCKMCGGTLEFNQGDSVGVCESCGTKQTLPNTNDDIIANLYNRANNLRLKSEFDRAAKVYEDIVNKDDSQAEAHWGIVLCKYGIEYVEDPETHKRIPTCHRASYEAIRSDADFQAAIDYSDGEQQAIYEAEARAIDRIQKGILEIAKEEKPFDVFICYKETDENGTRTIDSTIANDIYYQLSQEGFKVFYAAITLEDKLGQEYEPYIFAALNSAKVMLVIGTKPEYFNAVWVKNEWSRYLKLIKNDRNRLLIPCYRDMDAYDLPEEFAHLQAQDMSKIGFINDVTRGIRKILSDKKEQVKETVAVSGGNTDVEPLLKRAFIFLEDGDWENADQYCERVLDSDPENAKAYLGKLMTDLELNKQEQLGEYLDGFEDNQNYQKARRYADNTLRAQLDNYIETIKQTKDEQKYQSALELMNNAQKEKDYLDAAEVLKLLEGYKDSSALASECCEKAEVARKDSIYINAKELFNDKHIWEGKFEKSSYENAIAELESISPWKDSEVLISKCKDEIEKINAKEEANRLEKERLAKEKRIAEEKAAEEQRIAKNKAKKKRKIIIAIITLILVGCIAFVIVLTTVIIPNNKYNEALKMVDNGDVVNAYESLVALDGYKDSKEKANEIQQKYIKLKLKSAEVGSYVSFGSYEQDNDTTNGNEYIEWLVLSKEDNKVLVISKYALDCQPYNEKQAKVTWDTCTINKWLNETFYNAAFGSSSGCEFLKNNIILISPSEAEKYFDSNELRKCQLTDYCLEQGAYKDYDKKTCWWWLRQEGGKSDYTKVVRYDGCVFDRNGGFIVSEEETRANPGVRPAMWISLE